VRDLIILVILFILCIILLWADIGYPSEDMGYIVLGVENIEQPHYMSYGDHSSEGMPESVVIGDERYGFIEKGDIYEGD
jgi:hypothetical protein